MRKRRISPCFHFIVSLFGSCNTFSQVNVSVVTKTKSRLFKRAYCTTVARAFLSNTEWRRAERTPAAKLTLYSFSLLFSVRPSVNFHIIPCVKIKIGDSNEDETRLTRAFVYLGNFVLFLIALLRLLSQVIRVTRHTVRNLHFLSKNSTLISRENCRFFVG